MGARRASLLHASSEPRAGVKDTRECRMNKYCKHRTNASISLGRTKQTKKHRPAGGFRNNIQTHTNTHNTNRKTGRRLKWRRAYIRRSMRARVKHKHPQAIAKCALCAGGPGGARSVQRGLGHVGDRTLEALYTMPRGPLTVPTLPKYKKTST